MARYPFGKHAWTIERAIGTLHDRLKPLNAAPTFTYDEFLSLLAPPEHWPILKQAAEVSTAEASGGAHDAVFKSKLLDAARSVTLNFNVNNDGKPPLMPRGDRILDTAPQPLLDKLATWANREVEVARVFKKATNLFQWLNSNRATKDQIRCVWPVVVTLCTVNESTAELADRIREFKPQRSLPNIPLEVRQAVKDTTGLLTSASMIEGATPRGTIPQVTVSFWSSEFPEALIEGALGDVTP